MSKKHLWLVTIMVCLIFVSCLSLENVGAQIFSSTAALTSSGYNMTVSYHIVGGGSPVAPTIIYVDTNGLTKNQALSQKPITITMGKNKPWSVTPNPLSGSTSLEQWYSTQSLSGTTSKSGSATKTFTFKHQYRLTVSSPSDTPTGTDWYNSGTIAYAKLTRSTVQDTTGTRQVFTTWSGDASGTNLKSNPITMNAPKTATANWKTQYQVTFKVNPALSGTTTPTGTNYYDSGQNLQIKAKSNNNAFTAWTQTGTITFTDPAAQTTTSIINGPGTVTANFATSAPLKISSLIVTCDPSEVGINEQVSIIGTLTSKATNTGIGCKTITLTYCQTANSYGWTTITSVTTDSKGNYHYEWTPKINGQSIPKGQYFVMAAFNGDKTYKGSTALAGTNDASLTVLPEYALGALAALGACFVGLVVFKKRNSLSHLKRL